MSRLSPTPIGLDEISDIGRRVFYSRSITIQEVADEFDLGSLTATTGLILDHLLDETRNLTDREFKPQPDDVDGSDVWSAGEILSHLVEVEFSTVPFWESVGAGKSLEPEPELLAALHQPPASVMQGLVLAEQFRDAILASAIRAEMHCTGDETALHFMLGPSSVRAVLLGNCLHILGHIEQLRALRGS